MYMALFRCLMDNFFLSLFSGYLNIPQTGLERLSLDRNRPRKVGTISGLFIHPLKSCRGIEIESATADELGLIGGNGLGDRMWAIKYEHNDVKVSARECHQLFKIQVKLNQDKMVEFSYPGSPDLVLPLPTKVDTDTKVHIFGEDVKGIDCGDLAAKWVSAELNSIPDFTPKCVVNNKIIY